MRIGIDCRLWNESGVGRYVRNLVEHLQLIDRKNKYILFVGSKDREEILRSAQNDNFSIVISDIRWHTLEEQLKFPSIINKENLDLMHFPYFSVPIFYNKPYVVTIHDLILHHFPTGLASTLPSYLYRLKLLGYKFVIKKAAQNAKKIITVSNATKSEIVDHLMVDPSKVVVTYEGVNDKIRNPIRQLTDEIRNKFQNSKYSPRGEAGKILNTNYFLYVGNAYPHKNLDRLIHAFNLLCHLHEPEALRAEWPEVSAEGSRDIKLVFVGKEDYFYKSLKEKTINLGLKKSVIFLGEVNDARLASLYKNAKALIVPSLMEGFGLPGLEAMANKCLVLSSDIPSLREVYNDAAMYFNPYDIKDMVSKMNVILGDAGQARMTIIDKVEKGFKRTKMFSWEKMAIETLKIYENC